MAVKTFEIKGTKHYSAHVEAGKKQLREGSELRFRREPSNPYDCHAVSIVLGQSGAMLGYVPREMSEFVSKQILAGAIKKASVRSVSKEGSYLKVKVTYEFDGPAQPAPTRTVSPTSVYVSEPSPSTPFKSVQFKDQPRPVTGGSKNAAEDEDFWGGLIILAVIGLILFFIFQ
jgi:hypothetical protein